MWRCVARPCRSSGNSHSTFSNKRPQGPAVRLHTGSVGRSHFTFLKLSAKLYTSVFHHGLKVLSLKSQRGVSWADCVQKRKLSPRGSGQRVPLPRLASSASHFLLSAHAPAEEQASAGQPSGQAASMFVLRTEGAGAGALIASTQKSPLCFSTHPKSCV